MCPFKCIKKHYLMKYVVTMMHIIKCPNVCTFHEEINNMHLCSEAETEYSFQVKIHSQDIFINFEHIPTSPPCSSLTY